MTISDRPWSNYTASDYADAGAYCDACLINSNDRPRSQWSKGACKLPVKEPAGAVNRNGVHAAAAALAGARGGVQGVAPADRRAAARKLIAYYRQMQEEPPDAIKRMAR